MQLIIKKNVATIESVVDDDKKDSYANSANQTNFNRGNFKIENFEALETLKDAKWVEQNITGSNGRFVVAEVILPTAKQN